MNSASCGIIWQRKIGLYVEFLPHFAQQMSELLQSAF